MENGKPELRVRIDAKLLKSVKLAVVQHDTSLPDAVSQALQNWLRGLRPSRQSEENRR